VTEESRPDLIRRLAQHEKQARAPRLLKLARHPNREIRFRALWRLARVLPPMEVNADLFTRQRLRVVLPEKVAIEIYRNGFYELPLTRVLLDYVKPGMTFVDVGSLYGYYAVLASGLVGPTGSVVAFEPSRQSFKLLSANTSGLGNVRLEQLAVFSEPGTTRIRDFGARDAALNTLRSQARVPAAHQPKDSQEYDIACVTLDDYFAGADRQPDFVKIDAESVELEVLQGMSRLLKERNLVLSVEMGDYGVEGSTASAACIRHLAEHGYRCFEYADGALVPHTARDSYEYDNLYFKKA
jgi:FkbM family methyltransferase